MNLQKKIQMKISAASSWWMPLAADNQQQTQKKWCDRKLARPCACVLAVDFEDKPHSGEEDNESSSLAGWRQHRLRVLWLILKSCFACVTKFVRLSYSLAYVCVSNQRRLWNATLATTLPSPPWPWAISNPILLSTVTFVAFNQRLWNKYIQARADTNQGAFACSHRVTVWYQGVRCSLVIVSGCGISLACVRI